MLLSWLGVRSGAIALYATAAVAFLSLLDRVASPAIYTVVLGTLGGMHVLNDGFIWRRPSAGKGGMLAVREAETFPA